MRLFEIVDFEVVVNPVAYTLAPFKAVLDKYSKKDKEYVNSEMAYIYYFSDWTSDYSSETDKDKRKENILSEVFTADSSKLKIDSVTDDAIAFYEEKQQTLSMLLYIDAKGAINKIREYFRAVDLMAMDKNDKPIYDISKLTTTIEKSASLVAKMAELEDAIKKEKQASSKIRGVDSIGLFE